MSIVHEQYVRARFDAVESRFNDQIADDDFRIVALIRALGDLQGKRILDLGCGKGRIARRLQERGARVVGLDPSTGMMSHAKGLARVQGAAGRLPFKSRAFDAVIAVEVFEHLASLDATIVECARVCRPMGTLLVIDKNRRALDARRPWLPAAVIKRIDERRGRWMYPNKSPVRERWFTIGGMNRKLRDRFDLVDHESLLQPSEIGGGVFRVAPQTRLFVLWTAKRPKGVA